MIPVGTFIFVLITFDISSCSVVIELKDVDFTKRISEYDMALVMFYAQWCGGCQTLMPHFDLASVRLAENDPPVQLFRVDCIKGGNKTCESVGVLRYPTLKMFRNGNILEKEYAGPRDGPDGIVKYMAKQAGPGFIQLNSKEDYDKFLLGDDNEDLNNRVVGFFKNSSPLKRAFQQPCDVLREKFKFAITSLSAPLKEEDDEDCVILFRPKPLQNIFEPSQLKYAGEPTSSAIESWLKANRHGLADPRTRYNHEEFENSLVIAYYDVDYANNAKHTNYWRNRILKVAKNFASDFNFAISPIEQYQLEIVAEFGLKYPLSDKPIVLARDENQMKFKMTEEFSMENFESFLRKLKNKELEPFIKSEPIPIDNSKPVKVAVAKNFDDIVVNNGKDTLIEFHAPWCGHCKKLAPVWEALGEKMAKENVAIVKIDASANEFPSPFKVEEYPTIYWAPRNGKSTPIEYTGGRELRDFIKYIAKHTTHDLKNYDRNGDAKVKDKPNAREKEDSLKVKDMPSAQEVEDSGKVKDMPSTQEVKDSERLKDMPSTQEMKDSAVIEMTDSDFKRRITEYELSLVMFHAPWCGYCKKIKPEFDRASNDLTKNDPPIQLLKVDCTGNGKKTCNSFRVQSYPTLKIFRKGVVSKKYSGPKHRNGIVKYMSKLADPSALELNSKRAFEKFLKGQDNVVVGFFNKDSSTLKKAFLLAADNLRGKLRFGITSWPELLEEYEYKDDVILYRPKILQNIFEPSQLKYSGRGTKSAMESWLSENQHGLVDLRTRKNRNEFKNPLVVAYYNVDYDNNAKITNYWRNRVLKIAQEFASDFTFAISRIDDFKAKLKEDFGYKPRPSDKPVVFARDKNKKKFVMLEEFSTESFESFLRKLKNNELEPYLRSAPTPKDNSKPVKIAVAKNFGDVVVKNNKDTLIEFYAPWCGHCKKLNPIWEELGEIMADEDVAIVKMDATANDVPSPFDVDGYPTIYWAPKNDKSYPVKYTGERGFEDFVKYIAKYATYELKNYDRNGKLVKKRDEL